MTRLFYRNNDDIFMDVRAAEQWARELGYVMNLDELISRMRPAVVPREFEELVKIN